MTRIEGMSSLQSREWFALGVNVRVVVTNPGSLGHAARSLDSELRAMDRAASRFRDDSELARVNASAGSPVVVSPLLLEAVTVAMGAVWASNGAVDPTLGSVISELGYDQDFAAIPTDGPSVRTEQRQQAHWSSVRIDAQRLTICVPAGVSLDLGATAKALAADRAAHRIAREVDGGVLVCLGGDIAMAGDAPDGGWAIRVQDKPVRAPDSGDGPSTTVLAQGGGLATSSTTARRWRRGGRDFHHLIDPSTGLPATSHYRTISVAADSCVDANIATTAAFIQDDARHWLVGRSLPARLVDHAGHVTTINGWPTDDGVRDDERQTS